ncbi:hypothetical protein AURDEDRAFT_129650 [Auricularia subglabra TFB-10046 SS5]|nr:hypothetical protein AURDEDRAFT_129650 [Auricularia subglabra TFB-10046 SS5]
MPKASKTSAKKSASTSKVSGSSGPAQKRAGMLVKDPVPVKQKTSSTTAKVRKTTAGSVKHPKQQKQTIVLDREDEDDSDEYPADGLDDGDDEDDDDDATSELQSFVQELNGRRNNADESDGDEDEDEEVEDEQAEDDEPEDEMQLTTKPTQRKRKVPASFEIVASDPAPLPGRKPAARNATAVPQTPAGKSAPSAPLPYTPFDEKKNPKDASKPLVSLQSPTTRNVLKKGCHGPRPPPPCPSL